MLCPDNCVECSDPDTCTQCESEEFVVENGQCVKCQFCKTCSITKDNCLTCESGLYFQEVGGKGKCQMECVSQGIGVYGNIDTGLCAECDTNCKLCDMLATRCTACVQGSLYPWLDG